MNTIRKKKILLLVEGAKTDPQVMRKLLDWYEIDVQYEIVSYCTSIYVLYQDIFKDGSEEADNFDLLQVLKARETSQEKKRFSTKNIPTFCLFSI